MAAPSPITHGRTPRLHFRALTESEHARTLHEMDCDPEVMRFIHAGPGKPWAEYQAGFQEWLERLATYGPSMGFWAAHRNEDDAFVGWFHLRPSKLFEQRLELGYRFRRAMWGQGLATEGSRALVDYGFRDLAAPEVIALTLTRNQPSRRVMEKIGMTLAKEFVFPPEVCPAWSEEERRGVLYRIGSPLERDLTRDVEAGEGKPCALPNF